MVDEQRVRIRGRKRSEPSILHNVHFETYHRFR
jgi:hypothetical protein